MEGSWGKKGMHITWDCVQQGLEKFSWQPSDILRWTPNPFKGCGENLMLEKELQSKPDNNI